MRSLKNLCVMLLALSAFACSTPIKLPESFVALGDSGEGYRAITSDDARVWVRTLEDPTKGNVEFWAGNLERDFVEERGYELLDKGECENLAGLEGRWMEFSTNVRGKRVDYLVAVWSGRTWLGTGDWIQIVEFAADHSVYEARIADVRAALATVK